MVVFSPEFRRLLNSISAAVNLFIWIDLPEDGPPGHPIRPTNWGCSHFCGRSRKPLPTTLLRRAALRSSRNEIQTLLRTFYGPGVVLGAPHTSAALPGCGH